MTKLIKCPICDHYLTSKFIIKSYEIFECRECEYLTTFPEDVKFHVNKTYGKDYFFGGGAGYKNYLSSAEMLINHGQQYEKIIDNYTAKKGSFLDVGAAAGFILKGLADCGWQGYGIEPNEAMASYGRDKLKLNIKTGTIENVVLDKKFDLILFIQVIAHFIDPYKAVEKAVSFLSPKGLILIETWDWMSFTSKLFGKNWHEFSPPSVLHWFSKKSLDLLMKDLGCISIGKGKPKKYIMMDNAKSLLKYKLKDTFLFKPLISLLEIIPSNIKLKYPGEDLFWALYRRR